MTPTKSLHAIIAATALAAASVATALASPAHADDAAQILKSMANYLGSQKTLSASFDSDIEVITPELEKIQFASSGQLKLSRPDKLRVTRTGGYADVELVYDGQTISIYGRNAKSYVQANAPGGVDQMIDAIQERSGVGLPGTDLLLSDAYDVLMANVAVSQHIGQGVIDGVECEHLAFRTADTDWQIWVESGDKPVPRKYVITSKTVAGAPQYTLRLKDWKTDAFADADTFVFKPPVGATKVDLDSAAMAEFDEIPPGTPSGAKQ
ncbi:DUF2092 domain-containing protein [Bradyrhizobium oligotrophicum]|uniref:DUF2092 domain-containing protein n=1 Tax=Bradyrhizobium oligotrophicum TaxID=44255 RepID=UPI003EBD787B